MLHILVVIIPCLLQPALDRILQHPATLRVLALVRNNLIDVILAIS